MKNKKVIGRLKIVREWKEIEKIEPGDLVLVKIKEDLLAFVIQTIDKGAVGFIGNYGATHHGLIAARELDVPFYLTSREDFEEGKEYILSSEDISINTLVSPANLSTPEIYEYVPSRAKVFINLGFPKRGILKQPLLPKLSDGVGFARLEFAMLEILNGVHPLAFMAELGHRTFENAIYEHFSPSVAAFRGKNFWIRTDDLSPHQLRVLRHGERYEHALGDELVGFRGITRAIDPDWMNLSGIEPRLSGVSWIEPQLKAVARLSADFQETHLGIFAPMVHDVSEYRKWRQMAEKIIGTQIQYGVMVEVPSIAGEGIIPFLKEKLIDFMIIGSNDLTALTLGLDRKDSRFKHLFSEEHPRVLDAMVKTIELCKAAGVLTAIGGEAASYPSLMTKLHAAGIDIFSVSPHPSVINKCKLLVNELENTI